jgi:hypothetical protein
VRGTAVQLQLGDLLVTEGGEVRFLKYIGFEVAKWVVPETVL